jgi:hypothetical protein
MDWQLLKTELTSDPLARGYSGMDDQTAAASLTTKNRQQERTVVPSFLILDNLVPAEWAALTAQEKQRLALIISAAQVNLKSANTRQAFLDAFAGGTTTRANLAALQNEQISRGTELGLGELHAGDVKYARSIV